MQKFELCMCHDFIGNKLWSVFPSRCHQGRESWTNSYNLCKRKVQTKYSRNSNWPQFSLLTHTWWAPVHRCWTTCLHFLNAKYFSDQRKFSVQDARITLLKTSNLEQRESTQQPEKKSAKYPLAIIYSRVKFWVGTTENFNQPQLSLLPHGVHHPRRTNCIVFLNLFISTFEVVHGSTLSAGNPVDQFTLGSDLHLDDHLHPFFKNQKFFTGLA